MSLFRASRISSRGLIPTTYGGGGAAAGAGIVCAGGSGETACGFSSIFVGTSIAGLTTEGTVGFGGGTSSIGCVRSLDALDVASARTILSTDFLASPGVGTGVEQVSAAFPQLLASVAMELMARGGGGGGTEALMTGGLLAESSSRRTVGAGGGGSAGGGAETRVGSVVGHTIGLPISKARPFGV